MKHVILIVLSLCIVNQSFAQCDVVLSLNNTTAVTCNGLSDGTAQVSATTSHPPVSYFSNGVTNSTGLFSNYASGTHEIIATDDIGCKDTISFTINQPSPITLAFQISEVNCNGGNDGTVTVTPSGGVTPYSYNWSNNQTTSTISGLIAGNYTVTVTDNNGCATVNTIAVGEPVEPLNITFSINPVSCNGYSDGSVNAIVSGGTPNINGYVYNWNNNQFNSLITGLNGGNYTLTVTDSRGCDLSETITVGEPAPIFTLSSSISTTCPNGDDGQAIVATSGGTPYPDGSYNYLWNNPTSTQNDTATGLNGGQMYIVTITDANGCFSYDSVTVAQPEVIVNTLTITDVLCKDAANGEVSVSSVGGTPPFQYQWDANANNATSAQVTNLEVGIYEVTVTDFLGCETTENITISQPPSFDVLISTEDVICHGAETGSITALAAGGIPWYSYTWDAAIGAGNTVSAVENIAAGTYNLTVTDANGCENINQITINQPAQAITNQYSVDHVTCFGERDGQISINTSGGNGPYEYSLDGGSYSSSNMIVGLSADRHLVYIQDEEGCIITDTVIVTEPEQITLDLGPDFVLLDGERQAILPDLQNAIPPISYEWTPGDSSLSCFTCPVPIVEGLEEPQQFSLRVTDLNGCEAMDNIIVRVEKEDDIYVATGFTPNADGTNDFLYVQGGEGITSIVEFKVFDRWGKMVFQSTNTSANDPSVGWNGLFQNDVMNNGVYGWIAVVEFNDGKRTLFKGNTTLVR